MSHRLLARLTGEAHEQIATALGELLRRERLRWGLSRAKLLDRLGGGMSVQTLATYELATRRLSVDRFLDLCQIYEVDPGGLLNEASVPRFPR